MRKNAVIYGVAALLLVLLSLPVSTYAKPLLFNWPWTHVRHSLYTDGNGNNMFDFNGSDWCVRANNGTLDFTTRISPDGSPTTISIGLGDDFLVDTFGEYWDCLMYSQSYAVVLSGDRYWIMSGCGGPTNETVWIGYDPDPGNAQTPSHKVVSLEPNC
jgi:hypothetical protein